jgi:hypothetical protein
LCSRSVGVVGNGAIRGVLGSLVVVLGLIVLSGLVVRVVTLTRDHSLSVIVGSCNGMSVVIHKSNDQSTRGRVMSGVGRRIAAKTLQLTTLLHTRSEDPATVARL